MVFTRKIEAETKAYILYLRRYEKLSFRKIAEQCKVSFSSVNRIVKSGVPGLSKGKTKTCFKKKLGRPIKLDVRQQRLILRTLPSLRDRSKSIGGVGRGK